MLSDSTGGKTQREVNDKQAKQKRCSGRLQPRPGSCSPVQEGGGGGGGGAAGLVSPAGHMTWAEKPREAVWAALTQGGGHGTPRGREGSGGVLSRGSTAPQT